MPPPSPADPREELWKAVFDTYYDSLFEEMMADSLISKWSRVDEATRFVVAATATGSAVAGWALWSQPGFKAPWAVISGIAALLSIIHSTLIIPGKLKAHAAEKRIFAALRIDLETFRIKTRIGPDGFDMKQFTDEFLKYRQHFSECVQQTSSDIMRLGCLENRIQLKVDERLANEIAE